MKEGYIPREQRKTILFLGDDLRLPSGIGTMSKELIIGSAHHYNFLQVGAALNHPDQGKLFDLSQEVNTEIGISDSSVRVLPFNGYGNPDLIRQLLSQEKFDAIVHFTDPRYWDWLYMMSAEVRQNIPIFYYHIWDDLPAPHYNKPFYESCDLLMGISKQSVNISRLVLGKDNYVELNADTPKEEISKAVPKVCYVPHGISTKYFFPIDSFDKEFIQFKAKLFGGRTPKYSILYNNRNIRRKMTSDIILGFKLFLDKIKDSEGVYLVLHTQPIDENGTDLYAVINTLCPEYGNNIIFTNARFDPKDMNRLYNSCDVTINVASNEGWGLSSTEALMAGRVVINNVTGGLQDQLRFEDENGKWIEFNDKFASNHTGRYKTHGIWAKAIFPASINLQGSIPTPYIFDDRVDIRDIAKAMDYWYEAGPKKRLDCGLAGSEWVRSEEAKMTAEAMCDNFITSCDLVLDNWVPPARFTLYNCQAVTEKNKNKLNGIELSYE
jgi:glycosyltransferase involved in cell wall biosynthesis